MKLRTTIITRTKRTIKKTTRTLRRARHVVSREIAVDVPWKDFRPGRAWCFSSIHDSSSSSSSSVNRDGTCSSCIRRVRWPSDGRTRTEQSRVPLRRPAVVVGAKSFTKLSNVTKIERARSNNLRGKTDAGR